MELDLMFLKKTPPHSPEAERNVLGGILVNNKSLNVVLSVIAPDDFYQEAHRRILDRIVHLVDKGVTVELLSLSEELRRDGSLEDVGGAAYIASLMDGVPKSLNVEYYAKIIKEKALLRRLILSSAKIINASYEQKEDADDLLSSAQESILDVAEQRTRQGFLPMSHLAPTTMQHLEGLAERRESVTGVPSGVKLLDQLTAGFHGSELVIVAARPSMGKTAICLNISQYVGLKTDKSVGFFSMEMSKESIVTRLLCADAQVNIREARTGFVNDRELERLRLSAERLAAAQIYIDETPALTLMEMKAKARRLKLESHLDIVFVDYIQLMRVGGRYGAAQYQYTLQGDDPNELFQWAPRIYDQLRKLKELTDVNSDQQNKGLRASLTIDRSTASRLHRLAFFMAWNWRLTKRPKVRFPSESILISSPGESAGS